MSAFFAFELIYKGNEEDFKPLWKVLHQIEGEDETASDDILPMFQKDGNVITTTNSECYNIWGDDAWKPTADVYLLMAKAAPNLELEISSRREYEGRGFGAYTRDKCSYKNGKLIYERWAQIDSLTIGKILYEILNEKYRDIRKSLSVAIVGETKCFEDVSELEEYINQSGHKVAAKVNKRTHCVICNNLTELTDEEQEHIEKAKELELPILSELEFIATYGEPDYFEDFICEDTWSCFPAIEQDSLIYEAFSFEDFCKFYKVDDTVTEDIFQQKKESDDRIQVSLSKKASVGDLRETEVYYIDEKGIIRDESHNVDNKMMDVVKKWEEKFN